MHPILLARCLRIIALMLEWPNEWVALTDAYALFKFERDAMIETIMNKSAELFPQVSVQVRPDTVYFCRVTD